MLNSMTNCICSHAEPICIASYTSAILLQFIKIVYEVPEHLELIKKVGSGAYGCVASFMDNNRKEKVAIKKITNAFADLIDGKRILREIKLLSHFKHDNIIQILVILSFDDCSTYCLTNLMFCFLSCGVLPSLI